MASNGKTQRGGFGVGVVVGLLVGLVLALGQAEGRCDFSVERVAINVMDARIPDNAGDQPIDVPVIAGGPAAYFSTLPIKALVSGLRASGFAARARARMSATASRTARSLVRLSRTPPTSV